MEDQKHKSGDFSRIILAKEKQKLNALNEKKKSEWFGLGMFGMVGWSITVPTFLGTLGGIWLDKNYPQTFSWTITCLIVGLVTGCVIAWNWVIKENK
ncbi:ATP synthase subunit [Pedobacter changchengzhani]|uniref:ATP synthase subunit n=1 Tax=Pedobacter changchengzhani TaxID=2529274 RepID=A0A4R5MLI3_9SPHI|nr:AtpZ/AtpI family protein [Pedobacter changchengzhani]TDG36472.1 ATP synthase subunit [Pedobacter changchengzhani]